MVVGMVMTQGYGVVLGLARHPGAQAAPHRGQI